MTNRACNSRGEDWNGHASDCAVHQEPAYPAGPCNCGADEIERQRKVLEAIDCTAFRLSGRPYYAVPESVMRMVEEVLQRSPRDARCYECETPLDASKVCPSCNRTEAST